jgi:DNA-binding XRE family transcriptional regulator
VLSGVVRQCFRPSDTEEQLADPSFKAEWQRLVPAREFAATLLRYRSGHKLSQRALAERLGVSQPRIVKLESGEHNPEIDTIIRPELEPDP